MNDRILPHDLDAEQFLLEACFCPDGLDRVADLVTPDDFYSEGGELIFAKMIQFRQSGVGFTPYLIDQSFLGHPHYESIRRVLDSLVPVTAECAAHFARIVKESAVRRKAIHSAYALYESLHDPATPIYQIDELVTSGGSND